MASYQQTIRELRQTCPNVAARYVAEWNELQATPRPANGQPNYEAMETIFIDYGYGKGQKEEALKEFAKAVQQMSERLV